MSIFGIGTDLVNINRVQRLYDKYGQKFVDKILTPEEKKLLQSHANPVKFLANRFAGKEATVKALGTGFSQGVNWKDIGVAKHRSGQPKLIFSKKIKALIAEKEILSTHISLTDDHPWATAFVVLEKN
jgi:holo-[acyl-carrier protein] synthase